VSAHSRNTAGFTLLPVILTMGLIAAIAFVLNRDNGINADMVASQLDSDRARYAAEAGLQAVNARVQTLACAGGFPVSAAPVTNTNFGGASYSAYATTASGNATGLVATGSFNGTSVSLSRSNVFVYQTASKTYTLQPDASTVADTFVANGSATNHGVATALTMDTGSNYPLLKFALAAFPAGSVPLSATLSLYPSGSFGWGSANLFRMLGDWQEGTGAASPVDGANWLTSNGTTAWTVPGGDHHSGVVDGAGGITGSWFSFDATDLTAAWLNGRYPNYGVMLDMVGGFGTFNFVSSDSSDATHRPKLSINYLLPCGSTGPSDPVGGTFTLNPTADSFNDSGAIQANNGAATTLKVYYTPTRENRLLLRFDTSSIAAGTPLTSATLRLYVSAVGSSTANTKAVWANAISETWVEGAGNNTNKSCPTTIAGTSWSYSNNCTGWLVVHPPNTTQLWANMASMPTARTGHVVAAVNNKIYAIGGYNSTGYLKVVQEYDPATNTWATKAQMPTARADAAVAVLNGKIYVIGGSDGSPTDETEVYDPATNVWSSKKKMATNRAYLAAAAVNNKIYVIGGTTGSSASKVNAEYDPATDTWTNKANMTTGRMWLTVQSVGGKIYAIGGYSGSASLANNEMYDPTSNTWTAKAAMPTGTDSMGSAVWGNKIYLISGFQGATLVNAVLMYDTLNNAYTAQLNYPVASNEPAAAALNGKLYTMGGDNNSTTYYATHYRFDPGVPVPIATAVDEATSASPLAAGFSSGWLSFDLTTLTQEWVDGVRPNNGIVINTEVADQFSVNSRENTNKSPQLVVAY
jgi:N-acetylneuraminic acid mutarotase/Tfp pilus assembly protein PilX